MEKPGKLDLHLKANKKDPKILAHVPSLRIEAVDW